MLWLQTVDTSLRVRSSDVELSAPRQKVSNLHPESEHLDGPCVDEWGSMILVS